MYSQAQSTAFHKVSYIVARRHLPNSFNTVSNFFNLLNEIELNNKTTKQLNRIADLWNGQIPRGRVADSTRSVFFDLKNFIHEKELDEHIISDYLKARSLYYRKFRLNTKEDQLEYLHSVVEQEGVLFCYGNGYSERQLDFFKQDAKVNFLLSCLSEIAVNYEEINLIIPASDLRRYGLSHISYSAYKKHPGEFREFIERFAEEILYYQKIAKRFSSKLPMKFKLAKKLEYGANRSLLNKITAQPDWIFYNEPQALNLYRLKNSISRRLYA